MMTNVTTFGNIVWEQRWSDTGSCSMYQVQTNWLSYINSALRSYTGLKNDVVSLSNGNTSIVLQTASVLSTTWESTLDFLSIFWARPGRILGLPGRVSLDRVGLGFRLILAPEMCWNLLIFLQHRMASLADFVYNYIHEYTCIAKCCHSSIVGDRMNAKCQCWSVMGNCNIFKQLITITFSKLPYWKTYKYKILKYLCCKCQLLVKAIAEGSNDRSEKQSETRRPLPSICIACSFVWVSCVGRLLIKIWYLF